VIPKFHAISEKPVLVNEGLLFETMCEVVARHEEIHATRLPVPVVIEQFTGITNAVTFGLADGDVAVIFDSGLVDFIVGAIDGILDLLIPTEPESGLVLAVLEPDAIRRRLEADQDAMWLLASNLASCQYLGTTLCAIKRTYVAPSLSSLRALFIEHLLTWVVAHEFAHVALGHVHDPDHERHESARQMANLPKDHLFEHHADLLALEQCIALARRQGAREDIPLQALSWFLCVIQLLEFLRGEPDVPAPSGGTHPMPLERLRQLIKGFPSLCLRQGAITEADVPGMQEKLSWMFEMALGSAEEMTRVLRVFHPKYTERHGDKSS
jgi:hypothetical protein